MRSSTEDALSLIRKWRDNKSPLHVLFSGVSGVTIGFSGYVMVASDTDFAVRVGQTHDVMHVLLKDVTTFDFSDTRTLPADSRLSREFDYMLHVLFANGDKLGMYGKRESE